MSNELLETFKKELGNLKENDKFKINALTFFARDHKDTEVIAQSIVELTIKNVYAIPAALKLLGLYVIDSIVKNVSVPYRKLYTPSIVDAFVHSFQSIRDEKGRLKLYNLRTTWKDVFPALRMYELDVRVREHDPAWPLVATLSDSRASVRALPNIPKVQAKTDTEKIVDLESDGKQQPKASLAESRDPRLNRKRKSANDSSPQEEFLIDRSGDQKMEAVARKQGKQEVTELPKKLSLFGGHDLDMRAQLSLPITSPSRSVAWSEYIDKHVEIGSRREVKDIDMRFGCQTVSKDKEPDSVSVTSRDLHSIEAASKPPVADRDAFSAQSIMPATIVPPPIPGFIPETQGALPKRIDPTAVIPSDPPVPHLNIPGMPSRLPPPMPPFDPHALNRPRMTNSLPPRNSPDIGGMTYEHDFTPAFRRPIMRPPPGTLNRPHLTPPIRFDHDPPRDRPLRQSPRTGPPISEPTWVVEIKGFPDMTNIGVDPRMLSLVEHPKPPKRITIDGRSYSLLLDRVQPLIMVENQIHAVRFRCESASVLVDGRCFEIPGIGFTFVLVGRRRYLAYLGGPGHELVIDGQPHTVPLAPEVTYITVGHHFVGVKFVGRPPRSVNVLPAIPPRMLKWAGQGLFGSPRSLHLPPLNPLIELARLAEGRLMSNHSAMQRGPFPIQFDKRYPPPFSEPRNIPVCHVQHNASTSQPTVETPPAPSEQPVEKAVPQSATPPINVHELFEKLVKAGIVSQSEPEQKIPELKNYTWEIFKVPCPSEIISLYNGHQCGQCGLRFQSDLSPEFASHLDYHYMKNSRDDSGHRSRNFYQASRYWLFSEMTRDENAPFESTSPIPDLQESKCPAFADPTKNICAVCKEKFDVFWDQDEEEWMLRDAVLSQDKAYHPICQEDAGKEFSIGNGIDHEMTPMNPSPTELKPDLTAHPIDDHSDHSPLDENAFICEDPVDSTQIPGLSPVLETHSPVEDVKPTVKAEPEISIDEVKPELPIVPIPEHISADPLAALKAVLQGGMSSLIQPFTKSD